MFSVCHHLPFDCFSGRFCADLCDHFVAMDAKSCFDSFSIFLIDFFDGSSHFARSFVRFQGTPERVLSFDGLIHREDLAVLAFEFCLIVFYSDYGAFRVDYSVFFPSISDLSMA